MWWDGYPQLSFVRKRGLRLQGYSSSGVQTNPGWQLQGNCVICGLWGVLEHRCARCEKRSCGSERCKRLVKEVSMCGVPERTLKNRWGDLVESPSSLVAPSVL